MECHLDIQYPAAKWIIFLLKKRGFTILNGIVHMMHETSLGCLHSGITIGITWPRKITL